MTKHSSILGWLFACLTAMSVIGIIVVMFIFSLGTGIIFSTGASSDPNFPAPVAWLPFGFGVFIALIIAITTLPNVIAAYGLLKGRSWAKTVALIAGILNLPHLPFGTAVGIYAIWVYANWTEDFRPVVI